MTEALDDAEDELKRREQERLAEAARRARLVAKARFTTQDVNPFDVLAINPAVPRDPGKVGVLSEHDRRILQTQLGVNPDAIPYVQALQLLRERNRRFRENLCTFNQAKVLKRFGYATDMSFTEATATIDALARNGWRRVPRANASAPASAPQEVAA